MLDRASWFSITIHEQQCESCMSGSGISTDIPTSTEIIHDHSWSCSIALDRHCHQCSISNIDDRMLYKRESPPIKQVLIQLSNSPSLIIKPASGPLRLFYIIPSTFSSISSCERFFQQLIFPIFMVFWILCNVIWDNQLFHEFFPCFCASAHLRLCSITGITSKLYSKCWNFKNINKIFKNLKIVKLKRL